MNNLQKLGFDNWFEDKVDLSKTDFNIVRVISVNKNSFNLCHGATPELSGQAVAALDSVEFDANIMEIWIHIFNNY